ncbi:TPA: EamA family transporter [Klebsiella pneumoniae subsp. pneumoniae]|uniref:DMT family transporter n=1 Tax=Klebsiella pneumoniae TaxID=573 RepID=UPI002117E6E6|nr:EamA family transporter [Klebsiella pneumoniae]HDU3661338.1 EamA family transporter [Klebsiella pneumoniae subsp. pneumoniae]MCQ8625886.1 EamA family transporter [Klebsiella pneumoniae]HBT3263379.1 EamA family transporter [Klebsiella pneumoniae]HBT3437330.1 EamA family transporter [Klebsiella pneumoniae]HDK6218858.1 EamA family transporter [Klebsiella pneumoniae]
MAGVFMAAILWGTTGTAATFAPELSPLAVGAVSMGVGGLLQGLIAAGAIRRQRQQIVYYWSYLLIGTLAVAVYPLAFYASMHLAGVAVGTVVSIGSAPLLSALIEYKMEGLRLTRKWICGATIGVAGMALLSLAESGMHHAGGREHATFGMLLGLIAGFTYALYSWSVRRLMHQGIAPRAAMGATFSAGALLLMPVLLMTGSPFLYSWTNAAVGAYMALVPMFIGYLCYGMGLARVRASTATTITLLEPVVAAVLAVMLVGEKLPVNGLLGIGLIVLSLLIITVPSGVLNLRPAR